MNLVLERLEDRLLLAVSVSQKGSTLLVEFDADGDPDVLLTGTGAGAIDVTLADTPDASFTGIKNIKIVGNSGSDNVDLVDIQIAGNITADLKDGADTIEITGGDTDIGGSIKAKLGEGDDIFDLDAAGGTIAVGKDVTVDMGNADSTESVGFRATEAGDAITIGGNLTVKQKAGEMDTLDIDGTAIGKNVKIDLGDGDDNVHFGHHANDSSVLLTVGKSVTIKMGDGDDEVELGDSGDPGNVDITKNLTIDLGNATDADALALSFDTDATQSFHVGGNVSIKGKAGIQALTLDGFDVDGSVKVNLGDDDDSVHVSQAAGDIDSHIGKTLDVKLGDGEDDELLVERLTVDGKARIDGGNGGSDNADETAGGDLVVTGGATSNNFEEGDLA